MKDNCAIMGQLDEDKRPNGIVRVIFGRGNYFEGNMTPDGHFNGWGIHYFEDFILVGWRKKSQWNGNYSCYNAEDMDEDDSSGWYHQNERKGGHRGHDELKNIKIKDLF